MIDLPHLTVSGSPRVMGQQQGEHYKALIAEFVDVRFNALAGYLSDRKTKDTGLFETAEACMRLHESRTTMGSSSTWALPKDQILTQYDSTLPPT